MKNLNIDPSIIVDFYFKEIRSLCELACQVFHSGLTKQQSMQIENIQKKSLKIILGSLYNNYEEACTLLGAEPLCDRRTTLCLTLWREQWRLAFTKISSYQQVDWTKQGVLTIWSRNTAAIHKGFTTPPWFTCLGCTMTMFKEWNNLQEMMNQITVPVLLVDFGSWAQHSVLCPFSWVHWMLWTASYHLILK